MIKRTAPVSAKRIARAAIRSWVRSRRRAIKLPNERSLFLRSTNRARPEFVTGAVHSQKIPRVGGIGFKLLAKSQDVIINCASSRIIFIPPDLIQQLFSGDNSVWCASEEPQQLELLGGECELLTRA